MTRLQEIAAQIEAKTQPPVNLWKPKEVGAIDIRIDSNGFWFHEGEPILRDKLVALFASILWHENDQYYLVTPAEKLSIVVEDTPFLIHQMERADDKWVAVTNTHEQVIIGDQHPVTLRQYQGHWLPYVNVRYDLWARLNRSVYYQWVIEAMELAGEDSDDLWLQSGSYRFRLSR
jgi:hypothetical protein